VSFQCGLKYLIGGFNWGRIICTLEETSSNSCALTITFRAIQFQTLFFLTLAATGLTGKFISMDHYFDLIWIPLMYIFGTRFFFWSTAFPYIYKLKNLFMELFMLKKIPL
jgi:hypothetical protein